MAATEKREGGRWRKDEVAIKGIKRQKVKG
jgi:hypothetical protein